MEQLNGTAQWGQLRVHLRHISTHFDKLNGTAQWNSSMEQLNGTAQWNSSMGTAQWGQLRVHLRLDRVKFNLNFF
jgi:hypothetical protein